MRAKAERLRATVPQHPSFAMLPEGVDPDPHPVPDPDPDPDSDPIPDLDLRLHARRETNAARNLWGREWCELAAAHRLMEVARAAPVGVRIRPKAEPDDAVTFESHVPPLLSEARGHERKRERGERGEEAPPTVVWRRLQCGHKCARRSALFTHDTHATPAACAPVRAHVSSTACLPSPPTLILHPPAPSTHLHSPPLPQPKPHSLRLASLSLPTSRRFTDHTFKSLISGGGGACVKRCPLCRAEIENSVAFEVPGTLSHA